jgi:cAMP phosphodiesterase
VKVKLLPSTFDELGGASPLQHLTCFVIDGRVALDAGSLAMAATPEHRENVRDVVLSHAHLDHIAGLALFIDDLFTTLERPITVHGSASIIEVLERDIFNWSVYPRFRELENACGPVLQYASFRPGEAFPAAHLEILPIEVHHNVPSFGFVISDGGAAVAMTGDTAATDEFWKYAAEEPKLKALLVECAFPDELAGLAERSHHLTPRRLAGELEKFARADVPIFAINLKPRYREATMRQIAELGVPNLSVMEVGREYSW